MKARTALARCTCWTAGEARDNEEAVVAGQLQDKVAVITGAGSGIGAAVAEVFRGAGARLVVNGRRADKLEALGGDDVVKVAGDVLDSDTPARLLRSALDAFGRCDIMFNNAGVMTSGSIAEIDIDKVCEMARINVEAAYRVAYTFVRHFAEVGSGHLISTSSVLGVKVRPTAGAYCGTKYAIEALSEALRVELADTDVKISCVQPGLVMTELHSDFAVHPKDLLGIEDPLRPVDVANAVLFMATQPAAVLVPSVMVLPKHHRI